jgi:hypothetical protein
MKKCPTCNKTYSDDSMSFCLEDGAPLLSVGGTDAPSPGSGQFDPNMTIPFTPPRDTSGQGAPGSSPGSQWGAPSGGPGSGQFGGQPGGYGQQGGQGQSGGQWGALAGGSPASGQFPPPQPTQFPPATGGGWGGQAPPPPSYASPQKKSSALPWVLGGIALLVVLGVGAAVVIGVLASMGSNSNKNNSNNSNMVANRSNRNGSSNNSNSNNSNSSNSSNTNTTKSGTPSASDDFSSEAWWTGTASVGVASYQNGEYHLHATSTGYMVIYGPDAFRTENATTRVTARSVSGESPENGYGLAVFGEMNKKKELEDYCLLVRTTGTPAYKIVMHRGGNEKVLVEWTDASQLRTGTSPNQLEARASSTQIAFYINGQFVQTIDADSGYAVGLAGFYTSGTEEVAFDDLQIFK